MSQKYVHGLGAARWIRHDTHLWLRCHAARWRTLQVVTVARPPGNLKSGFQNPLDI